MKNLIFIITIGFFLLSACSEEELDLAPVSNANAADFYKTAKDFNQAVLATYDILQSRSQYGHFFIFFMESRSDNADVEDIIKGVGDEGNIDLFREIPTSPILNNTWISCYAGIQRCNTVLDRIDNITMDEKERAIRKGEVKFIRALTYFNLVRIWGDVPLVTKEFTNINESYDLGRTPVNEVYTLIIKDLQEAAEALPLTFPKTEVGRATKGTALTLLGKVYLTRKNYQEAVNTLRQVITSGTYTLLPNYADVFDINKENGAESIFEIQFLKGGLGEGGIHSRLTAPLGNSTLTGGVGNGIGDNLPTANLLAQFDSTDTRLPVTIGRLPDKRLHTNKYLDKPFQLNDDGRNVIVLRYADVILMLAEALNELGYTATGEAFTLLNQIRTRAKAKTYTATDLPNQASFRLAIEKERRLELALENHRWFDLLRTGRALEVMNQYPETRTVRTVKEYQLVFPIPQSQVDVNPSKMTQNTGY
jgi:tetratricopeptide (TPR) repeat protein